MKFSHFSFLALALALVHVHAQDSPPDAVPGPQVATGGPTEDGSSFPTDIKSIEATALKVDQTSVVDPTAAPNQPPAETEVTAVDGELTDAGTSSHRRSLLESRVAPESWEPVSTRETSWRVAESMTTSRSLRLPPLRKTLRSRGRPTSPTSWSQTLPTMSMTAWLSAIQLENVVSPISTTSSTMPCTIGE